MKILLFCLICGFVISLLGCGNNTGSSSYSSPSRPSQVMTEGQRSAVVDNMVGQGASREDADAFTKALNDAQREWEANQ
tara:strand:+ start:162 stop:398 length:237 start_codon:yes stop_codon:yes gene_type:complete